MIVVRWACSREIGDLELQLAEQVKQVAQLQSLVCDLASKVITFSGVHA